MPHDEGWRKMAESIQIDEREGTTPAARVGTFAPLSEAPFRRIWSASVLSNFSQLFLGVGAAWEMTRLSDSPSMVALVQTAMMLPLMVIALPAGAIADMFDRRKTAMAGLSFAAFAAAILAGLSYFELVSAEMLLVFCSLVGVGFALFLPSWQSSIPEQVSRRNLPAAVALGTISFNVARSIGPALGGVIVLAAGAKAVFALTSILYAPLLIAFFLWKRQHVPPRLPRERFDRAIIGGARYALHSPNIKTALARVFAFGLMSASAMAFAPLIAKDLLDGDAALFGVLLGAQGLGAVMGALFVTRIRERISTEGGVRIFALGSGLALAVVGLSASLILSCLAFFAIGACNILIITLLNVTVQLSAPRWVAARALSLFSSAITAGLGIGAWAWGVVAEDLGLSSTLIISGIGTAATLMLGYFLPLRQAVDTDDTVVALDNEIKATLPLTMRSGPVVVEIEYHVELSRAREFYRVMMEVQQVRKRIGGFAWSISRDIADPRIWIERYHCPTWGDYLRMRDRYSQADYAIQTEAASFNISPEMMRVSRRLERPFGSVRWQAEAPDPRHDGVGYIGP